MTAPKIAGLFLLCGTMLAQPPNRTPAPSGADTDIAKPVTYALRSDKAPSGAHDLKVEGNKLFDADSVLGAMSTDTRQSATTTMKADTTADRNGEPEVIGEVDFSSALTTVHPQAIYLHQGQQYHVDRLDFPHRKAYVKRVNVDYFTDAIRYTQVRVLEVAEEQSIPGPAARAHGDVLVRSQVVGFKKIKFFTNENVGAGKLQLPENEMHTTAFWITLKHELLTALRFGLSERQSGIFGSLYALESMATLLLMCDRRDLGTAVGERSPSAGVTIAAGEFTVIGDRSDIGELFEPNLYIYDAYPGGIGFSESLHRIHDVLLQRTRELIAACPCENGCPSCVGPAAEKSERTKEVALAILQRMSG